jgi:hypothetical protein
MGKYHQRNILQFLSAFLEGVFATLFVFQGRTNSGLITYASKLEKILPGQYSAKVICCQLSTLVFSKTRKVKT